MCGIFGVINFNGKPVDQQKLISARDTMFHRGPDDEGLFTNTDGSVGFGFRRLSIIDLSAGGHQPMSSPDGRYIIVFNGEIYNYKKLGMRLEERGEKLYTNSDTEVLLRMYMLEGADCLNQLRGMFAFAIWDEKEKSLFISRDRFGIKPLYYLHKEKEFIFSSELKAIKHYKNGLTLSIEAMDAFLKTGSIPAPLTIYEETKALPAGHWLEYKCHTPTRLSVTVKQYWSFFDLLNNQSFYHGEVEDESGTSSQPVSAKPYLSGRVGSSNQTSSFVRTLLLDTIRAHMVSDVEVGAFLSGGIDSTAIVSLMRQAGHEKIKTISVTFPGNKLDEAKYSNLAAKKYETDHFEYRLQEEELINNFDKIIEAMDQPTIDGINTYFVSKAAASFGLKVVLSGLGGDELFGGYPSFINIPKYQRIKSLPFAKPLLKAAGILMNGRLPAKAIEYFKNPDAPNAEYRLIRGLFTDAELRTLGWNSEIQKSKVKSKMEKTEAGLQLFRLSSESDGESSFWPNFSRDLVKDRCSPEPDIQYQSANQPISQSINQTLSVLQSVSMLESCIYMRNQLLRDSDVFSMTHSLELRVPFVDNLHYSNVLPYLDSGFDKSFSKKMLVDAVGDLPDEIVHRPKQGFTFPFVDWMKHRKIKEAINDLLVSNKMQIYFNQQALVNLQKSFELGNTHWSRVWAMYVIGKSF